MSLATVLKLKSQPQVWLAELTEHCEVTSEHWLAALTTDEKDRYARFKSPIKAQQFLMARILCRYALSQNFGHALSFWEMAPEGTTNLINNNYKLSLNISHSGRYVCCVFLQHGEVGIDIEQISKRRDYMALAEQYFSPAEVEHLQNFTGKEQELLFYRMWTTKEAYLKTDQSGVTGGLSRVGLLACENGYRVQQKHGELPCSFYAIDVEGYCLTVAYRSRHSHEQPAVFKASINKEITHYDYSNKIECYLNSH